MEFSEFPSHWFLGITKLSRSVPPCLLCAFAVLSRLNLLRNLLCIISVRGALIAVSLLSLIGCGDRAGGAPQVPPDESPAAVGDTASTVADAGGDGGGDTAGDGIAGDSATDRWTTQPVHRQSTPVGIAVVT